MNIFSKKKKENIKIEIKFYFIYKRFYYIMIRLIINLYINEKKSLEN